MADLEDCVRRMEAETRHGCGVQSSFIEVSIEKGALPRRRKHAVPALAMRSCHIVIRISLVEALKVRFTSFLLHQQLSSLRLVDKP
jgi:hypothetical protein